MKVSQVQIKSNLRCNILPFKVQLVNFFVTLGIRTLKPILKCNLVLKNVKKL